MRNNAVEPEAATIAQLLNSIEPSCQSNVEFSELSNELLFELFASYPERSLEILEALHPQHSAYILQQLGDPIHEGIALEKTFRAIQNTKPFELDSIKQAVLKALTPIPTVFSLISQNNNWQARQYFLTRIESGIEQRIEIESTFSDWEVLDGNRVLALSLQSEIQILDFTQPNTIKKVPLDLGSDDILEIALFEGGFYFVSAEAEHLAFTTSALWRYEWASASYNSIAIPDSLNMSGLTCSKDGSQIAFVHTISSLEDTYEEIYQLIHFDLASQNVQILDQGLLANAERFVRENTPRAIHFLDDHNLVYLKSINDERNVFQMDLLTQTKSILSILPYYVSSITLGPVGTLTYRSKDKYLVSLEWETGDFQKQAIPTKTSVLSLQYH
ncbi:MAG: hypothetical protein AB8H47_17355 [Bacteroidia bacterium]